MSFKKNLIINVFKLCKLSAIVFGFLSLWSYFKLGRSILLVDGLLLLLIFAVMKKSELKEKEDYNY